MTVTELGQFLRTETSKTIAGQESAIEQTLVSLLARGHVLLEGVPGIAKTLIARTIAHVLGCDFKRIQFTPDLMPSDITGTYVFESQSADFRLKKGPIFTNVLLADEINRTPPKTQSALLQAMEERCVSIDGIDHPLDQVFFVMATQNPIEYEGTYPLPEAQLDRFLMKIFIGYPSEDEELDVLKKSHAGFDPHDLTTAGLGSLSDPNAVLEARDHAQKVTVDEGVMRYAASIVRETRSTYHVVLGGSPRASVALLRCGKALAALRGRDFVTPDDIKGLAPPVLRHRLILSPESSIEGVTPDEVIAGVLSAVPVPR